MKGEQGEAKVLESITQLLRAPKGEDNFFIIPKYKIPSLTGPVESDLILIHPVFGLFIIEVKNWKSMDSLNDHNSPFDQVFEYRNLLLSHVEDKLKNIPINIEPRVIFPSISKEDGDKFFSGNPQLSAFQDITFFADQLTDAQSFDSFFLAKKAVIPNKKAFLKLSELFLDRETIKSCEDRILPVITKDEVMFFDYKQLSILDGYTGGFRIIRGVAGTGKTIIMTNFVANRLKKDPSENFMVLAFNRRLVDSIKEDFSDSEIKNNVDVLSLQELLKRIKFDEEIIGGENAKFAAKMEALKSEAATREFRKKFKAAIESNPIDYFMCDETQDMPPNIMRVIYEVVHDCIFFIDEAQRFFNHSMTSISEVFHHPEFDEKISMRGRVKNLKNVYRTPSNIAKTAFSLLGHDKGLNDYYKKSYYLKRSFVDDINFVLEDGRISIGEFATYTQVADLVKTIDCDNIVVLTSYSKAVDGLNLKFKREGIDHRCEAMTYKSIKGLEGKTIVLHNFIDFLEKARDEMLFRSVYVVLTRALENLYVAIPASYRSDSPKIQLIIDQIRNDAKNIPAAKQITVNVVPKKSNSSLTKVKHKLAKLSPSFAEAKDKTEFVVAASQLFALVAGLFTG